jgi:hypothetical protein
MNTLEIEEYDRGICENCNRYHELYRVNFGHICFRCLETMEENLFD